MVEPLTDTTRPARARPGFALAVVFLAGLSGCGLVPKSRMDECHRVTQTLRAENSRLKDLALDLRTQNQDLSQRAVDDARQIAAKDEANERLVKSVQAYQGERDKLAEAFLALERQVRMTVNPHPAARPSALKAFAKAHPGWTFDEARMTVSAPPALLFRKGTDALTPEAAASLKALAAELSGVGDDALSLEVVGPAAAPPVALAGFEPGRDDKVAAASGRFLGAARAARVRDRLVTEGGLDPSRVRLAPPPRDAEVGPDNAERRVEIRIASDPKTDARSPAAPPAPKAAGLDSAPARGR